ncbi:MAG: mucoidy inhibitor MuiA family protein [Planktomarina sp.]
MKHLLLATVAFLPMTAMADSFQVPMVPANVIVYPQGAMVQSRLVMDMPAGRHDVAFLMPRSALSGLVPQIEVAGAGVLGMRVAQSPDRDAIDFLTDGQRRTFDQHETLKTDLETAEAALAQRALQMDALKVQAAYLQALKPATETAQTLEDLQAIVGYLPTALADNASAQVNLTQTIRADEAALYDLRDDVRRSEQALSALGLPSNDWAQVVLDLDVASASEIGIQVDAFTAAAGWTTRYDVHLNEDAGAVTFDRSAAIMQYSGQGWSDVALTLSSAKPFQKVAPTRLFRDIVRVYEVSKLSRSADVQGGMSAPMMDAEVVAEVVENSAAAMAGGTFDGVAVSFEVDPLTNVMTDDGGTLIPLEPLTLEADIDRYANARFDQTAFVRAKMTNGSGQPILSGEGKLFRDGNLIGTQRMSLIASGADQTLFFGPDDSLPVKVSFLNEMSGDEGFFTTSNTRQEEIAIDVSNLSAVPQDVVIAYATPVSVDENVEVAVTTRPTADRIAVDGEPGGREWDFALGAGASGNVTLDFEITWPDGMELNWSR